MSITERIEKLRDKILYNTGNTKDKQPDKEPVYLSVFGMIYRHPIISAALLCFFCILLTTGNGTGEGVTWSSLAALAVGIVSLGLCAGFYTMREDRESRKNKLISFGIMAAGIITAVILCVLIVREGIIAYPLLNVGFAVITGIFIYLGVRNKLTLKNIIILIMAAGFLIRLSYVLAVPNVSMQHDVSKLGSGRGHLGYIEYLYNNKALPDFDVRTVYQFYHPPLHHTLSAIWVGIQQLIGIDYGSAFENIQLLTLFYSTLSMILSYKIFRQLRLRGIGLAAATAVVSLCPTFYIMAGSINNDMLSVTFMLGAILNTIYWYKEREMKRIIFIALCVGLGMMTKLSVWMVAPAIAFVFIYVFIKNIRSESYKDIKKYITQFAVFLAVCAPLGLWWSFRNYISHGVPFTYVMELSKNSKQYIGDIPVLQRLFDFSFYQFSDVGDQFTMYSGAYNEFNPIIALFKTSMFDEGITAKNFPNIAGFNTMLFWSAVVLGLIGFVAMIYAFSKKSNIIDTPMKIFVGLIYFVIFISYYIFCFKFPQVCTQNIRYAVPLIAVGAYFIGFAVQSFMKEDSSSKKRLCGALICGLITFYSICGSLVYGITVFDIAR